MAERGENDGYVVEEMHMRRDRVEQKRKKNERFRKDKRFKYQEMTLQFKKENKSKVLLKRCNSVSFRLVYICHTFAKKFMWRFARNKKKRMKLGQQEKKFLSLKVILTRTRMVNEMKKGKPKLMQGRTKADRARDGIGRAAAET
ncbi:hypothetical protein Bca4012_010100 [Brassica carinata]